MIEPSESNPFARAGRAAQPPGPLGRRARLVLGLFLSVLLAGLLVFALFLLGALLLRGARRDWLALAAAIAVIVMTIAMARSRRRRR